MNLYPENKSGTLVLIGQLCNDGCEARFNQHQVAIKKRQDYHPTRPKRSQYRPVVPPINAQQ
eukprot:6383669-Ditylum_brightwellii.AAC.1